MRSCRLEVSQQKGHRKAYRCMGSHASDVTHFECPFSASPIALPVIGSQSRTFTIINRFGKRDILPSLYHVHAHHVLP